MLPAISRPLLVRANDIGQAVAVDVFSLGLDEVTHYIDWSDTSEGGEVTIETASDAAYTGTWGVLQVVPWTGANRTDPVRLGGVYQALRHRVSQSILAGTVTTRVVGSV